MPYNENIPQASDKLKNSQPQLLSNFQAIDTVVAVNHVTFDDPSGDQGKHKFVTFPRQSGDPVTLGTEINMYTKLNATTAKSEIYVKNGVAAAVPITASAGPNGIGVVGFSYIASGLLMRWGSANSGAGSSVIVNLTGLVPAINNIKSVQITALNANTSFWVTAVAGGTFTVNSSSANRDFGYFVIGN